MTPVRATASADVSRETRAQRQARRSEEVIAAAVSINAHRVDSYRWRIGNRIIGVRRMLKLAEKARRWISIEDQMHEIRGAILATGIEPRKDNRLVGANAGASP